MSNFPKLSLGDNYPYWKYINSPSKMGMDGNRNSLTADVKGLMAYSDLLISGQSRASATGHPLGNQYFLNTGGQCCISKDSSGNCIEQVDRYMYINSIPDGSIPFIQNDMSSDSNAPKGLLIGILEDLEVLDPFALFDAFTSSSNPTCMQITLQVTDTSNNVSQDTQYVAESDVNKISPCKFTDSKYNKTNPFNNKKCGEAFSNINNAYFDEDSQSLDRYYPTDPIILLYFILIFILGLYIFYKISYK